MFALLIALFLVLVVPGTLILSAVTIHHAVTGRWLQPLVTSGQWIWFALAGAGLLLTFQGAGDYQHLFWGAWMPMQALMLLSGFMLLRVWPDDRREFETVAPLGRVLGGGAAMIVIVFGVLGLFPLALVEVFTQRPEPRIDGAALPALVDVVAYGFGGDVPETMLPVHAAQVERRLGSPPRWVTVPMGTTLWAALSIAVLAAIGLGSIVVGHGRTRRCILLIAPACAMGLSMTWHHGNAYAREDVLWRNEPWLVERYGSVLLFGALGAAVLLLISSGRGGVDGDRANESRPESVT